VAEGVVQALQLYKQGCDGGDLQGCSNLGWLYEKGAGVSKDLTRARELYKQACDGGNQNGCTKLLLSTMSNP
jgi:hypothetical protein